jgi:DNA-binding transcriptional ArsR family regulator
VMRSETRITDLAKPFAMSLPAVSKHIRILERAGLLTRAEKGTFYFVRRFDGSREGEGRDSEP